MSAYSYWEKDSKELFNELFRDFSVGNVRSFLESIWLGEGLSVFYEGGLSKVVYMHGDQDEVYTARERVFIGKNSNVIVFSGFTKQLRNREVICRIVAVNMNRSFNPIYDGINFMKIFHKAMHKFNIYVLAANENVYLGCDLLGNGGDDCYISFPLKDTMDWDAFSESMMYITQDGFYSFYQELISAIKSIKRFYTEEESESLHEYYEFDHVRPQSRRILYGERDYAVEEYEAEISDCKQLLSYIRANAMNSLELLYEAETAEKHAIDEENSMVAQDKRFVDKQPESSQNDSVVALLDNPEALIHALKKRRKCDEDYSLA